MPFYVLAAEYNLKTDSPSKSKIVLNSDEPWLASDNGQFVEGWTDDYGHHVSHAVWEQDSAKLTIAAFSLSGLMRWRANAGRLRERDFRANYGGSMTSFAAIDCSARSCVRFDLLPRKCAVASYFTAPPGSKTQSDKGKDLVRVTYCSKDLSLPDDMDRLLSSIKIRKNN